MNKIEINENVDSIVITGNNFELYSNRTYSKKFNSVEELIGLVMHYFNDYKYGNIELHKLLFTEDSEHELSIDDITSGICTNKDYIGNAIVQCYKEYLPFVKCVLLDMGYEYSKSKGGKKKALKK